MDGPRRDVGEPQEPEGRSQWERPTLKLIGNVRDLVRGGNKTGDHPGETDPTSMLKPGSMG